MNSYIKLLYTVFSFIFLIASIEANAQNERVDTNGVIRVAEPEVPEPVVNSGNLLAGLVTLDFDTINLADFKVVKIEDQLSKQQIDITISTIDRSYTANEKRKRLEKSLKQNKLMDESQTILGVIGNTIYVHEEVVIDEELRGTRERDLREIKGEIKK
jgi:hypothetical protein